MTGAGPLANSSISSAAGNFASPGASPTKLALPRITNIKDQAYPNWLTRSLQLTGIEQTKCTDDPEATSQLDQAWYDYADICSYEGHIWDNDPLIYSGPIPWRDELFREFFTANPVVLNFIRKAMVWKTVIGDGARDPLLVKHLKLSWLDLCPLRDLALRWFHMLEQYLTDEQRAGALYRRPEDLKEDAALAMIAFIRQLLDEPPVRALGVLNIIAYPEYQYQIDIWAVVPTSSQLGDSEMNIKLAIEFQ
ncbi:hypothetical protein B0H16DRAFT_1465440 [Mycena metata]|uniref:Uncharacterized protein n=1 Tax=Mycena metata TaxID=1033252 RepID=A0AAD7MZF5_9AGAR|nr:hypothetical protein B0H16DRAFT_1465440 [Mycena metata]